MTGLARWQTITTIAACIAIGGSTLSDARDRTAARPAPIPSGCRLPDMQLRTSGPGAPRRIALTFDDGPKSFTAPILDQLNRFGARATFFEEGRHVSGHEELMRRILRSGSEIGNHSTYHTNLPSGADLAQTNRLIRRATGFRPCLFRPPYGEVNGRLLRNARERGLTTILWDVHSEDEAQPGVRAIYSRVVREAHPGAIVLLHDGGRDRSQTVRAVPLILRALRRRGYRLVTVTELLGGHFELRGLEPLSRYKPS